MNKKKQIKEMTSDIIKTFSTEYIYAQSEVMKNISDINVLISSLISKGYRKITENEIVISKEEYETKKEIVAEWGLLQQEIMQGKFVALADLEKEGKVVLSKEEYELLTNDLDKHDYGEFESGYSQGSKETAREILSTIGNMLDDCDDRFKFKDYQWHRNMCKKYGVDIGEEE